MDDQTTVSVILPTYNRAGFVGLAVQSVLDQTYTDFELLIIDDGSTDTTVQVLEPFFRDSRVRYIHQPNRGQNHARNHGLREARGELICFLDSDDLWTPEKLADQVRALKEQPEYDIVHGDEWLIDVAGNVFSGRNMKRHSGNIVAEMLVDNSVSIITTMARRHCFDEQGGFSDRYRVADDYELWLRLSAHYRFLYIPKYFAYYRVMDDQISSDPLGRLATNENIILDFLNEHPGILPRSILNASLAGFYTRKARILARHGYRSDALRALGTAFHYRPLSGGVWRGAARVILPARPQRSSSDA